MNSYCSVYSQDPWLCPGFPRLCRKEGATASFCLQQYFQAGYRLHHSEGVLRLIPIAGWYGVPSMAWFFLLPSLQAHASSRSWGGQWFCSEVSVMPGDSLFSTFRSVQQFFCLIFSAVEADPLYACYVVIIIVFNKWIKYQYTVGTEGLAVSSVDKPPVLHLSQTQYVEVSCWV